MSTVKIRFSYDIVTEESALEGDVAEYGWYFQGGYFDVSDPDAAAYFALTAREAVRDIKTTVGCIDSVSAHGSRATFYPSDGNTNYRTGEETRYYAHIEADPRLIRAIVKALK